MSSNEIVMNYVGLLQERCMKAKQNMPQYTENKVGSNFRCVCLVLESTTEGVGLNKKIAKQTAAKAMLEELETEILFEIESPKAQNPKNVSKLNSYSINEKKGRPLYSLLPEEDGQFVYTCTFDGFTAQGKDSSKKIAKEKSADAVAKHFNLNKYFEDRKKLKEKNESLKSPVTKLYELCREKKLDYSFVEKHCTTQSETPLFVISCSVGEFEVMSAENSSKKLAKLDAATKMLHLLTNTLVSSQDVEMDYVENVGVNYEPPTKRIKTEK